MSRAGTGPAGAPVVVIGASLSGLFAAAAAAVAGRAVVVLERDRLPAEPVARRGVPQGRQTHVLLHRGLLAGEELLPGLERAIEAAGAVRVTTAALPWYGMFGWQPTDVASYDMLALSRPLLEQVVRGLLLARPEVELREGVRVQALEPRPDGWRVACADGSSLVADVVVDASGRGSRLPQWLTGIGVPTEEPQVLDASVGYASQLYRVPGDRPLRIGLMVGATPDHPQAAVGLPVEDGHWLVAASGYGEHRPARGLDFEAFLAGLRDPAMAEVVAGLEPVGEPALHRQTGNRRHRYGRHRDWPEGLLVVGDALCALDPLYGQGIAVGACQALVLRDALRSPGRLRTRTVQRQISRVTDLPWLVASSEDARYLPGRRPPLVQRLATGWTIQLALLAYLHNRRALESFGSVYHLMAPPRRLVHPALVLAVLGRLVTRRHPAPAPRPAVLTDHLGSPVR